MALSLYEGGKRQSNWPFVFMAVNLLFAGGCMFWWSVMAIVLADAMSWATWSQLSRTASEFYSYPFVLLWALPIGCSTVAWMFQKASNDRLATAAAMFPIMLLGFIVGWYHLAPPDWR